MDKPRPLPANASLRDVIAQVNALAVVVNALIERTQKMRGNHLHAPMLVVPPPSSISEWEKEYAAWKARTRTTSPTNYAETRAVRAMKVENPDRR